MVQGIGSIVCKQVDAKSIELQLVVNVIHDSFREPLEKGIVSLGSRISVESLRDMCKSSILLIAQDRDKNDLVVAASVLSGNRDGYIELIAVAPEYKRMGIGTKLLREMETIVLGRGGRTIWSDTGVGMHNSIKWHHNNGFRKDSFRSFPSTNYYSFVFRKDLSSRLLGRTRCAIHLIRSFLLTVLTLSSKRRPSKRMSLQEIQHESLLVLEKVHKFCMDNNIRYSLAYGTLIGAVRHRGFIPWDDDIDIIMPRPDYERFLSTFFVDGLGLFSNYSKGSYILYSRVYDYTKTTVNSRLPFANNYQGGIWIDIFPADCVEDDFVAFKNKVSILKNLYQKQLYYRDPKATFGSMKTIKKKLGLLSRKILRLNGIRLESVNNEMNSLIQSIPWGSTGHWSQMACMDEGEKMYQLVSDFNSLIPITFEGEQFMVVENYDVELRKIYDNYMNLPPEEERLPKQDYIDFYWI